MLNIGDLLVDSLDYILIVDKESKIVYATRYDASFNSEVQEDILGKYFFDVYKLERKDSSIFNCLEKKEIIISKHQKFIDYRGREFITNNITVPIIIKGNLMGVIELSMDVDSENETKVEKFNELIDKITLDSESITFDDILTQDIDMIDSINRAKTFSKLPNHVLIYGETGTGKELVAQSIINESGIDRKKVVIQNCAAVPSNLIEGILFGTIKGAYTGAENQKGLFEEANNGIIFLDELSSMPYEVQSKLLRVIQDGSFRPIGSTKDKKVNVKIIAAMNIDPIIAIEKGTLRNDLFYRFSNGLIYLPSLKNRKKDILLYCKHFLEHYCKMYSKEYRDFSSDVMDFFLSYSWEGNVRELKNAIEQMVILLKDEKEIGMSLVPKYMKKAHKEVKEEYIEVYENEEGIPYKEIMEITEKKMIIDALKRSKGNKTEAARILDIPRKTLDYRIEKLNIVF